MNESLPYSDSKNIEVAFSSNDSMVIPLAVAIHGLLSNLHVGYTARISILNFGIHPDHVVRLERLVRKSGNASIVFLSKVENLVSHLPEISYFSLATYGRLLLPEVFPDKTRIIYLDADLVVNRDMSELWNIDLGNRAVAAVPDEQMTTLSAKPFAEFINLEHGLQPYFNAGVLLINLALCRKHAVTKATLDFLRSNTTAAPDQDALNVVLAGQVHWLPRSWNVAPCFLAPRGYMPIVSDGLSQIQQNSALLGNAVYHFTGPFKPWNGGPRNPAVWSYVRHLRKSKWLKIWQWPAYFCRALFPPRFQNRMKASTPHPDAEVIDPQVESLSYSSS